MDSGIGNATTAAVGTSHAHRLQTRIRSNLRSADLPGTIKDAQLSQRHRAARCFIVLAKSGRPAFKVIQGHRGRYQSKPVCDFLLVINSN